MSRRTLGIFSAAALAAALYLAWGRLGPADIANAPPREGPIIAFGDSLTEGIGAPPGSSYPDQLSRIIGRPVLNRGVAGETAAQALRRIEQDVIAEKPSIVIVCLGGNDLLQRRPAEDAFASLRTIVERILDSGAMVLLVGVEGLPMLTVNYEEHYDALAKDLKLLYLPDFLRGLFGRSELMADTIHPNAAGYAITAERIAAALRPYLKEQGAR